MKTVRYNILYREAEEDGDFGPTYLGMSAAQGLINELDHNTGKMLEDNNNFLVALDAALVFLIQTRGLVIDGKRVWGNKK